MATGAGVLALARQHLGEIYRNVTVPKNNPNWTGPWDCAEFASWLVYQESGTLYGCTSDSAQPALAEAWTGSWERDSAKLGQRIPVQDAAAIPGAFLLRFPPAPKVMGHIAVSDGTGKTVEAMGRAFGVNVGRVSGRRWSTGVLVPGISYATTGQVAYAAPAMIYYAGAPNMMRAKVTEIQQALKARGFDPGPIDGEFGDSTTAAVAAFQENSGLVSDGDVGPKTAEALGIEL